MTNSKLHESRRLQLIANPPGQSDSSKLHMRAATGGYDYLGTGCSWACSKNRVTLLGSDESFDLDTVFLGHSHLLHT